jgi:hypothetical protein
MAGRYVCAYDGRRFDTLRGLGQHYRLTHKLRHERIQSKIEISQARTPIKITWE